MINILQLVGITLLEEKKMAKIVDKFLEEQHFNDLKNLVTGISFPWFFINNLNDEGNEDKDFYFYMSHLLYDNNQPTSNYFDAFVPLLSTIDYKALIRVKANLYPRTKTLRHNGMHVDTDYDHKGFLFYFNTCDSKTILKDMEVDCVANRGVYFNPSILHSSSSCTNVQARFSLNVNYF